MKNLLGFLLLTVVSFNSYSQLSSLINSDNNNFVIEPTWNRWINIDQPTFSQEPLSRGLNVTWKYNSSIKDSTIALRVGLGWGNQNIYHNSFLTATDTNLTFTPFHDTIGINKNKISLNYFEIPVELTFKHWFGKMSKPFKFGIGFKAGVNIGSYTKFRGEGSSFGLASDEVKVKQYGIPHLAKYQYGLTARFGYSLLNISAYYGLSPVFDLNKSMAAQAFTVGISLDIN